MPRIHGRRTIPALVMLAAASAPAGSALAASTSHKYKGPAENTRWGPVQVTITVKNKKITGVSVSDSTHTARSAVIASGAIPTLKQEVLQAQSANINTVSGATDISNAFIQSLQGAVTRARQAKAL